MELQRLNRIMDRAAKIWFGCLFALGFILLVVFCYIALGHPNRMYIVPCIMLILGFTFFAGGFVYDILKDECTDKKEK